MKIITADGTVFEQGCEMFEVTMAHRPDTSWVFVDAAGHEHRWYVGEKPATSYRTDVIYSTPTLHYVKDGEGVYEDGQPYESFHLECRECNEHIDPRYKSDDTRQFVPGLRWCSVNGESVSQEEFEKRLREATAK